jgi:hypothetical protein
MVAQEINIIPELKNIESGNIKDAKEVLNLLKVSSPNDPSVIFLDAVLTEDGETAIEKYEIVYTNFPKSKFADASLYRIFSYYYALGIYKKAEGLKQKLIMEYPNSPYIKAVNRKIPDDEIYNTEISNHQFESKDIPSKESEGLEETSKFLTVQAGAFLNIDNAMKLKDNLENAGYNVEIKPKEVGGSTLNVVTAEKFPNRKSAEDFLLFLKNKFNLNGRIISNNN